MAAAAPRAALAPTAATLEHVLCHLVLPDTATIQKAEAELERLSDPKISPHFLVPEMVQLIQISQRAEARHMAAVLLRKRLIRHWLKLPVELHAHIKTTLMTTVLAEPVPLICHATARAVRCGKQQRTPLLPWFHVYMCPCITVVCRMDFAYHQHFHNHLVYSRTLFHTF